MNNYEMPKLQPLPIETKGKPFIKALSEWMFSKRKWKLVEDWHFTLPKYYTRKVEIKGEGVFECRVRVVIPSGFVFDGASIPRPFWAILSPEGLLLIPGLIHDFAYRCNKLLILDENGKTINYEEGKGRRFWDRVFLKVAIDVNGFKVINTIAYTALFIGGWAAWRSNRKRKSPDCEKS